MGANAEHLWDLIIIGGEQLGIRPEGRGSFELPKGLVAHGAAWGNGCVGLARSKKTRVQILDPSLHALIVRRHKIGIPGQA